MHDMTAKLSGLEVISHMRLRKYHRQLGVGAVTVIHRLLNKIGLILIFITHRSGHLGFVLVMD